jgi:chromosome segregation protein
MDTGVGRTSYSIMAQGQIDQILSSKPEERRVVFEEAAGITKYKSQRREAMNKLALTEQNLARVSDVINEVARQIGSLKRQAAKAMRFKRVSFRLRHLALAHSSHQFNQFSTALTELESRVAAMRGDADTRRTSLEERTRSLDDKKLARSSLNQRVQDSGQEGYGGQTHLDGEEFSARIAIRCLHGKPPQVAEYRRGLSRASTCVSLFIGCGVKDELCRRRIRRLLRTTSRRRAQAYSRCANAHLKPAPATAGRER